jgi:hypothetical protein
MGMRINLFTFVIWIFRTVFLENGKLVLCIDLKIWIVFLVFYMIWMYWTRIVCLLPHIFQIVMVVFGELLCEAHNREEAVFITWEYTVTPTDACHDIANGISYICSLTIRVTSDTGFPSVEMSPSHQRQCLSDGAIFLGQKGLWTVSIRSLCDSAHRPLLRIRGTYVVWYWNSR